MADQTGSKQTVGGPPAATPPSWGDVATQPLTIGALLMTAAGGATGVALLSYGFGDQGRGSVLGRMVEAVFEYESAFYGLAVVFLIVSVLFLVMRDDKIAPLTFALMSILMLLIIPVSVLVLDVAPWVFGGRLTSGSPAQVALIFSPLVALLGWLVAVYAVWGGHSKPAESAATGSSLPTTDKAGTDDA